MLISNLPASRILRAHGASACTDVTGFGLAGHLVEMLRASRTSAAVDMRRLPVLTGALDTTSGGILSSLHSQNAQAIHLITNAPDFAAHQKLPLLFDPQTSGGLLAGVAAGRAEACVQELRTAGCRDAAVIGEVRAAGGGDDLVMLLD